MLTLDVRKPDLMRLSSVFTASVLLFSVLTAIPAQTQGDSRLFPETGKTVKGLFLTYWNEHGGLAQQGFPISDEMQETSDIDGKIYTVQYFERAVFEKHPENKPPYDVLLTLLGRLAYKDRYPAGMPGGLVPLPAGSPQKECSPTHDDSDSGPNAGAGFDPEAPQRDSVGKGHIVTGTVFSSEGCAPIAGVKLEMRPDIDGAHPEDQRATLFTDASGRYHFESKQPEHIHMRISAHGFKSIIANGYHPAPTATQGTFDIVLVPDPACRQFAETGQSLCGPFLDYWNAHGALAQQGYPISAEFSEVSALNGKPYTVQYFERAVFEMHPENQPPYDVLLSQLGTFRYRDRYASQNLTLDQFYDKIFSDIGLRDPENFTSLGLPRSYKPDFHNDTLTNVSDAYLQQTFALDRQYLQQLGTYDPKKQMPQQAISTAALTWYLNDVIQDEEFMYDDYVLSPATGAQVALHDLMVEYQPLTDAQDAQAYITRLNAFPGRIDGVLEQMHLREQKGSFMPGWMMDGVIDQINSMIPADVKSSDFYDTFARKVGALTNISSADKQTLYAAAEKAVTDNVYPSYRKLADYLTSIRSKGRTTDGVWALPNGDAYYSYLVRHHTNTNMTPEEVHNLGLSEVSRVQGELRQALDALGYKNLSIQAGVQAVAQAAGFYNTTTPAGKQQVLDAFRALIDKAQNGIASQFDLKPKAQVEVRAVPPEQEATAPGGYYFQPSLDGTRPGVFYANLGIPNYAKYAMPTLAYHEAVPGHHFQLSVQVELQNVPLFQKAPVFPLPTAFVEGWGLYAEQLASDAGLYKDDPYGNIGRLKAELFRASRLVVDTGIHWKRWTRQQAIDYMDQANFTSGGAYTGEVNRYIAWPGQALAYKVGELKIVALREDAKARLGSKFNIKEFHNAVLGSGSIPLPVLEQAVSQWVGSK